MVPLTLRCSLWRLIRLLSMWCHDPAIALKRLVTGFPPWRPRFASGHHVGFVVDKAALGQVFSEYFSFPCQSFHQVLHHHNHLGLAQDTYQWPQCRVDPIGLHPPLYQCGDMRRHFSRQVVQLFHRKFQQTSQYAVPCGGIFLGKWCWSFTGGSDGKMNVQSACTLNTRYFPAKEHISRT
jgi:hypothetical protein